MTEENDAVAIVVSEETGIVSLALDGQIERDLDGDRLKVRLHQLLRSRHPEPVAHEVASA